ncbi:MULTISPECIES: hypothetical protein [Rhodococcus]|uniref:hypothetical protein n=1 Tax=Rhodococcus TaxID=1827 RepID=UPI001141A1D1|nr:MULTISPECIES: hypothetical protein [Rhodococcus]MCW2295893.1 hypothetical protein [Rhodococcus erythropolis]TQC36780.1 hypothetical protein EEB16_16755 [Rhodococcus sp. WS7]
MSKRPELTVAWIPWLHDIALDDSAVPVIDWLHENTSSWNERSIVVCLVNDARQDPNVRAYSSNGNIVTHRNRRSTVRGGPVLAYGPGDEELEIAASRAAGHVLGLVSFHRPTLDGFAAATRAFNVLTGQHHPGVSAEKDALFDKLNRAGYKGFSKRDAYAMRQATPIIDELLGEGFDADFIVTYSLACGMPFRHAKELRALLPIEESEG